MRDAAAAGRAKGRFAKAEAKRAARTGSSRRPGTKQRQASCVAKASFGEELAVFKAIVRHLDRHDLEEDQAVLFTAEQRQHLRRLRALGIKGHMPGIKAVCTLNEEERQVVAEAIASQRCGCNPKFLKAFRDMKARQSQARGQGLQTMLMKKVKLDSRSSIRWKRVVKHQAGEADDVTDGIDSTIRYSSRKLHCTRCGALMEITKMQLRTDRGCRDLHCTACGLHSRCGHHKCQCNEIWHRCLFHRADPGTHRSLKAKAGTERKVEQLPMLNYLRLAPEGVRRNPRNMARASGSSGRREHVHGPQPDPLRLYM